MWSTAKTKGDAPTSFERLYRHALAVEPTCDAARPNVEALRRMLAVPAMAEVLRVNYEAAGVHSHALREQVRIVLRHLAEGPRPDASPPRGRAPRVGPMLRHVVARLALHVHAPHPDCRRWALACAALHGDERALDVVCDVADRCEPRVRELVVSAVDWMVSECNRRGSPVLPYRAPP
jgi:hypothetical protein